MLRRRRLVNRVSSGTLIFAVLAALTASSHGSLLFPDFSSTVGLTLNGSAASVNNGIEASPVLRLANATEFNSGSVFSNSVMDITRFSTMFQFRITEAGGIQDIAGETGADGIAFVIQPVAPTELGGDGAGLGYAGIAPSVAVELDTFYNDGANFPFVDDPDSNHVGFDLNGDVMSSGFMGYPGQFDDGDLKTVLIDYDGTSVTVNIGGLVVGYPLDIPAVIGTNAAYVGFTAATGGAFGNHDIVSWEFKEHPVPEPVTFAVWALLALTAGGACWWRRHAR